MWYLYEWDFIYKMVEPIGTPLLLDKTTLTETRPTTTKLKVEIDPSTPLIHEVILEIMNIDGMTELINQIVEYETIPSHCSHCKTQGRKMEKCRNIHPDSSNKEIENLFEDQMIPQHANASETNILTGTFIEITTLNSDIAPITNKFENEWQIVINRKSIGKNEIVNTSQGTGTSASAENGKRSSISTIKIS